MFIRRDRKSSRKGEQRVYISLAHNVRERLPDGSTRPKPITFARLGREEDLDADLVIQMRDALDRYLRKRFGDAVADEHAIREAADDLAPAARGLQVLASRAYGMRIVVEHVWKSLGLDRALSAIATEHAVQFPFERVVFAMVLNRLVDPASKRACNEWVRNEAWLPEAADVDVQHFYRALDLMDAHTDAILDAVGRAAREACPDDELATLLIDTTTSYFESEFDDVERRQILEEWEAFWDGRGAEPAAPPPQVVNDPPLRMRGHSKDRRPREPQIKIGLVTTARGQMADLQLTAGNESDQRMTLELLRAAQRRLEGHRLVAVMDSGMGGGPNLKAIDELEPKVHRVSAVPLRQSKAAEQHLLSRPGRWAKHPYREGFVIREVLLDAEQSPSGRPERWIATRNEAEARRQRRVLDRELERIRAGLAEDDRVDGHGRPVCKLLANPKRRKFLRRTRDGQRWVLDTDRVRLERRRAGVHVLRSTLVDEPIETTLRAYDAQYGIEAEFRTLKSPLKLRPMHHRAGRRIRGHVLMCGLALMVARELERRSGMSLDDVRRAVGRVRAVQIQQGRTRYWQREEWDAEAERVLDALGVKPGPRSWGAERVQA